jgi:hypothetical protein
MVTVAGVGVMVTVVEGVVTEYTVVVTGRMERKDEQKVVAEVECWDNLESTASTNESRHARSIISRKRHDQISTLTCNEFLGKGNCKAQGKGE